LLHVDQVKVHLDEITLDFLASLPRTETLSAEQRRGIIARYASVLEGNFIYWMTGAYLAIQTEEARSIILENLREEIRDCHPGMMRRFAISAHALPTETDAAAVYPDLSAVRSFVGRLSGVQMVAMMAFFEGLLQKFMPYLADLAKLQGSHEFEYTDVHGVCDIAHTEGLFQALGAESDRKPLAAGTNLYEGVHLLHALLNTVIQGPVAAATGD
jgi:hypothetical protein